MTKRPLVSIITVVLNNKENLGKTILNVAGQGYKYIEHIVIDGGSTDGTIDVLKKYDSQLSFWSSAKDRGIADAMNKGVACAHGDILTFLNAGDYYVDDNTLSYMSDWFSREQWWWAFGLARLLFDFRETNFKQRFRPYRRWHSYYYTPMCHQATFYRRQLFNEIGLYKVGNDRLFDIDFVLRSTRFAMPATSPRYLVWYDTTGYSSKIKWRTMWDRIQVVAEAGQPSAMLFWALLIAYRHLRSFLSSLLKAAYRRNQPVVRSRAGEPANP